MTDEELISEIEAQRALMLMNVLSRSLRDSLKKTEASTGIE
jgi:hypothetical protein